MAINPALLAAGGGALLGGLNSGSNTEHIGSDEMYPDWYRSEIESLMGNIPNLSPTEFYPEQLVADQNPWMRNNLVDMNQWGNNNQWGGNLANRTGLVGANALGAVNQGMDFLGDLNQRGANEFGYDQGTFDTTMANLMPGTQNAFDVNARNMQQNYDFNALPGMNLAAANAGGYGGSKALQESALGQACQPQQCQPV